MNHKTDYADKSGYRLSSNDVMKTTDGIKHGTGVYGPFITIIVNTRSHIFFWITHVKLLYKILFGHPNAGHLIPLPPFTNMV